jgi:hypothetical protein
MPHVRTGVRAVGKAADGVCIRLDVEKVTNGIIQRLSPSH